MKFKDFKPYNFENKYDVYMMFVFMKDNKRALIKITQDTMWIREKLKDCDMYGHFSETSYSRERNFTFIHLNISSKDYKKILGY